MIALAPSQKRISDDSLVRAGLKVRREAPDPETLAAAWDAQQNRLNARYDAASGGDWTANIFAAADDLSADAANSQHVRQRLVRNSRYEDANNGYAHGIASTWATDVVGSGPVLRMQTGSEAFNRMVEREFMAWAHEIGFRRKLWTLARALDVDGESFGIIRRNDGLRHRVKLDWSLHETDQCRSPMMPWNEPGRIDGIWFDQFGNIRQYEFLRSHPGDTHLTTDYLDSELIPARFVCHWYRMERSGQHRGIPAGTSTLNMGAASRRWREAVINAAEQIADYTLIMQTNLMPDEAQFAIPFDTMPLAKGLQAALPAGYNAFQPKAEQPTATHGEFNKSLVSEQARPRGMPYNKAAADSSNHNFASGRLDHIPYYDQIDNVARMDCDDLVLDKLFDVWFDVAVIVFGWLGGDPAALNGRVRRHSWDWPKHTIADEKSEAQAKDTKLKNGSTSLAEVATENGEDYEDRLVRESEANGLTVDEQRQWNFVLNLPQALQQATAQSLGLIEAPAPVVPAAQQTDEETDDET